jgi:hypothetical protein
MLERRKIDLDMMVCSNLGILLTSWCQRYMIPTDDTEYHISLGYLVPINGVLVQFGLDTSQLAGFPSSLGDPVCAIAFGFCHCPLVYLTETGQYDIILVIFRDQITAIAVLTEMDLPQQVFVG